jgi:ribonuclease P/MRP protein subunit RPP1
MRINDDVIREYDLIALEPLTERAFTSACANGRADIIALQLGLRPAFRVRTSALKSATQLGVAVEVSYTPALADAQARRNFFANAAGAVRAVGENTGGGIRNEDDSEDEGDDLATVPVGFGSGGGGDEVGANDSLGGKRNKSRRPQSGIVLTSGSRQAVEVRAPRDVANLAFFFGMRDENARAALSTRGVRLVRRARRKRAREREAAGAAPRS